MSWTLIFSRVFTGGGVCGLLFSCKKRRPTLFSRASVSARLPMGFDSRSHLYRGGGGATLGQPVRNLNCFYNPARFFSGRVPPLAGCTFAGIGDDSRDTDSGLCDAQGHGFLTGCCRVVQSLRPSPGTIEGDRRVAWISFNFVRFQVMACCQDVSYA